MNHYWLDHYDKSAVNFINQPLKQVGKTMHGVEISAYEVQLIAQHVRGALGLTGSDTLVDLCCGNGLLTLRFAEGVGAVIGVDFSAGLLEVARSISAASNIQYIQMDVTALSESIVNRSTKYSMYEALQHLSPDAFDRLLCRIAIRQGPVKLLVGGIPDKSRLRSFYVTDENYRFYQEREATGRPHLGRWWTQGEVLDAGARAGYTVRIVAQPAELYTSHYRFDALFERAL